MLTLNADFERPSTKLVAALAEMPASVISDALGRAGGMNGAIQPLRPDTRMAGVAFTVRAYPADNLMLHLALRLARPGDILVVDAGGFLGAALWGELTSMAAMKKGLGGLVIDGAVRDREEICELGFPVFARGCTPAGTFKANLGALNVSISCGGVGVCPGDVVVGDGDGVVVIPREHLDSIVAKARGVLEKEDKLRAGIESGVELFELLGLPELAEKQGVKLA